MEDNKINYESTSDDNTSEENVGKNIKTRKASSKYINPYGKQKQVQKQIQQQQVQQKVQQQKQVHSLEANKVHSLEAKLGSVSEPNKNNEPKNVSNDIRKIIKVSNPTLLLIKGRR